MFSLPFKGDKSVPLHMDGTKKQCYVKHLHKHELRRLLWLARTHPAWQVVP